MVFSVVGRSCDFILQVYSRYRGLSCEWPPSRISHQLFHSEDLWQPISHCSISLYSLTIVNKGNVDILIDKFMLAFDREFNSFNNIPGSNEIVLALMSDHHPRRMLDKTTEGAREVGVENDCSAPNENCQK